MRSRWLTELAELIAFPTISAQPQHRKDIRACAIEVRGPKHDLHSGRYGGAVLNPLQTLSEMIAGLHYRTGKVALPGFYQRVRDLKPTERQQLRCACKRDQQILADLDLPMGWGEPGYDLFERMTSRPSIDDQSASA